MAKRFRSQMLDGVPQDQRENDSYQSKPQHWTTRYKIPKSGIEYSNSSVLKVLKLINQQMLEFKDTMLSRLEQLVKDTSLSAGLREVHAMNICGVKSIRLTTFMAIRSLEFSRGLVAWSMHVKYGNLTPRSTGYTDAYPIVRPKNMTLDILLLYHELLDIPMTLSTDYKRITYLFLGGVYELKVSPKIIRRYYGTLNFMLKHARENYIYRRRRRLAKLCFQNRTVNYY